MASPDGDTGRAHRLTEMLYAFICVFFPPALGYPRGVEKVRPRRSAALLLMALGCLSLTLFPSCRRKKEPPPEPPKIPAAARPAYGSVAVGDYATALERSEALAKGPVTQSGVPEAIFLQGYVLTYGQYRFGEGRRVLKGMVEHHATHPLTPLAQKAYADSLYWQGLYDKAIEEYVRLQSLYGAQGWGAYALYQCGNCMMVRRKDGEALTYYRSAAEKFPGDPMADAALLRVALIYRMLEDDAQAREELQKVLKVAKDPAVRATAMQELESIDYETQQTPNPGAPG